MRYVSEEEDKVRWQDAGMYALLELQDGVCIYSGRKETKSSKGVRSASMEAQARVLNYKS
jgi:hypothetical protein